MTSLSTLSDTALLNETVRLAAGERTATARLIRALAEVDSRRLYLSEGHSCMFYYCTTALHLSEQGAYRRIEVARVSRMFPSILDALEEGALTLTTAVLIAPHLTPANEAELLEATRFKTKRDVERLLAARNQDSQSQRFTIQLTVDEETYERFMHAKALLRHQIPDGDGAAIFKKALTLLIADVERKKLGVVARPRAVARGIAKGSRHIPASVRRKVWVRDHGRCAFRGPLGRCEERGLLEYHHVHPFAEGGPATVENIELRCRAHNAYEAARMFPA